MSIVTHFIRILGHALLKSRNAPHLMNVKCFWKIKRKCLLTYPIFQGNVTLNRHIIFLALVFILKYIPYFQIVPFFFTLRGFLLHLCVKAEWKCLSTLHFFFIVGVSIFFLLSLKREIKHNTSGWPQAEIEILDNSI